MLYMKGTPQQPQCGFSQQVCRVLHATGVEFDSVNVLEDESFEAKQCQRVADDPRLRGGALSGLRL